MVVKMLSYLFEKKFFGDFLYFVNFMNIENFFHENTVENIIRLSKYYPAQKMFDSELL